MQSGQRKREVIFLWWRIFKEFAEKSEPSHDLDHQRAFHSLKGSSIGVGSRYHAEGNVDRGNIKLIIFSPDQFRRVENIRKEWRG